MGDDSAQLFAELHHKQYNSRIQPEHPQMEGRCTALHTNNGLTSTPALILLFVNSRFIKIWVANEKWGNAANKNYSCEAAYTAGGCTAPAAMHPDALVDG